MNKEMKDKLKQLTNPDQYETIVNFKMVSYTHVADDGNEYEAVKFIIYSEKQSEDFGRMPNKDTVAFGLTLDFIQEELPERLQYFFHTEEGKKQLEEGAKQSKKPDLRIVH